MKQFKTLLKVNNFKELELIEEISSLQDKELILEMNIQRLEEEIEQSKQSFSNSPDAVERMSLIRIINVLRNDIYKEKLRLNTVLMEKDCINEKLVEVRQDIKAIEKLLEKKKESKRIQELYKEQELLDELNILES